MDNSSLKSEYISIKELSEVVGIGVRGLRKRLKGTEHQYISRIVSGRGGKAGRRYEILIGSLEDALIQKIIGKRDGTATKINAEGAGANMDTNVKEIAARALKNADDNAENSAEIKAAKKPTVDTKSLNNDIQLLSNEINDRYIMALDGQKTALAFCPPFSSNSSVPYKEKEAALKKFDLVYLWFNFREEKENKKEADNNFIKLYNLEIISKPIFRVLGKVSVKTLYRWANILKNNGNNYLSLCDKYEFKDEEKLNTSLSDYEKVAFMKIFFNDGKLNLGTAYDILKDSFLKRGLEVKSEATYRRFYNYIKRNHNDFNILMREGEKALKDRNVSYIRRDISDLEPGDALVADGNKLDFQVINPYTGKKTRAILIVFLDWVTFDVAGFEIMLTENTLSISSALRNSIINMNKIPKFVYIDNGRAFRGSYFTGMKQTFHEAGLRGVYQNLGIKLHIATAYNGRAKVVERFFLEFVKSAPPLVSSYIGSSIINKPAHLKRNEKFHKEIHKDDRTPTIEEAKRIIELWLQYYRRKIKEEKGMTLEDYKKSRKKQTPVSIEMLDELLMAGTIRTARRCTIRLFNREYECLELYGKTGKFIVKYSLFNMDELKVYDLKGKFIGSAKPITPVKAFAYDTGSANDIYRLKAELKKQKQQVKTTINKARDFMKAESIFDCAPWAKIEDKSASGNKAKKKIRQGKKQFVIDCFEDAPELRKNKIMRNA